MNEQELLSAIPDKMDDFDHQCEVASTLGLLTGSQIKLARTLLGLSKNALSELASVGTTTIARMEESGSDLPPVKIETNQNVAEVLTQIMGTQRRWKFTYYGGLEPMNLEDQVDWYTTYKPASWMVKDD